MGQKHHFRGGWVTALLIGLAACDLQPTAPAIRVPAAAMKQAAGSVLPKRGLTLDEKFAQVAQAVPGFGGIYIDANGRAIAYLTDTNQATNKLEAVAAAFAGSPALVGRTMKARIGKYDATQLAFWHAALDTTIDWTGVVSTDFDEAHNRVTVGVDEPTAIQAVLATGQRLGIPNDAIYAHVVPPIHFVTDSILASTMRPVPGGMQIATAYHDTLLYGCTFGFNTWYAGHPSFVTASHCTKKYGGLDTSMAYQPLANNLDTNPDSIGYEVADPAFTDTVPGCLLHHLCRRSDAAVFRFVDSSYMALAKIAQPLDSTEAWPFSLSATPFDVSSTVADVDLVSGATVNKVGASTGWTYGPISATCETVQPSDYPGHYLICNYAAVDMSVNGGDSGSPVFEHASNGSVYLAGLLWGTGGVFSSFEGIEYDVGTLYPL
jgi:hypothetical protein